jgi:hypothetical protein
MSIDAAMERRHAQRAADIRAERQRAITGGERGRRSARRSAGSPSEVVWVVRRAVDVVVALQIAQTERHVSLAENDPARVLHAHDR